MYWVVSVRGKKGGMDWPRLGGMSNEVFFIWACAVGKLFVVHCVLTSIIYSLKAHIACQLP